MGDKSVMFKLQIFMLDVIIDKQYYNTVYLDRKMEGRGNTYSLRIEQTIWPYKDMLCVQRWSDAGSGVGKYNAESPKQCSKMFNCIMKTTRFALLGILFIYDINPQGLLVYYYLYSQSRTSDTEASLLVPDFYYFCMCTAVHVIISFLASFWLLCIHFFL